jgi:hypothetical protein
LDSPDLGGTPAAAGAGAIAAAIAVKVIDYFLARRSAVRDAEAARKKIESEAEAKAEAEWRETLRKDREDLFKRLQSAERDLASVRVELDQMRADKETVERDVRRYRHRVASLEQSIIAVARRFGVVAEETDTPEDLLDGILNRAGRKGGGHD